MTNVALLRQHTGLKRILAATMIALLAVFSMTVQANAHDDLIGSTPKSGQTVEESPAKIILNFSGELETLAGNGGTVVVITNSAGEQIPNDFEVDRRDVVITPSAPLTSGEYSVASRVISSDGHPIEKSISFTVDTGETTGAPAGEPTPEATASAEAETSSAVAGMNPIIWVVIGVVIAGAAIAVLVNFMRRNNGK